jgi:hypothetical protein
MAMPQILAVLQQKNAAFDRCFFEFRSGCLMVF